MEKNDLLNLIKRLNSEGKISWPEASHLTREYDLSAISSKVSLLEDVITLGKMKTVDGYGGGEGDGETFWIVIHFIEHNAYIQMDGWYASYEGVHCDGTPYLVEPQEEIRIVYKKV